MNRTLRALLLGAAIPLVLQGCPRGEYDTDGDGTIDREDCAPENPDVYPGAPDPWGDGIDQDCDLCEDSDGDGVDSDCDGYPGNSELTGERDYDCDDNDPDTHPNAWDVPNDDIDQDCDGVSCVDVDLDGYCAGLDDCDDTLDDVYLGAPEQPDCVDHDCDGIPSDGTSVHDDDGDGACEAGVCCDPGDVPGDCDDDDPALNLWDLDGDGVSTCAGDCDDGDDDRWPGAEEICDGEDNDCDGEPADDEEDHDDDGESLCEGDCDDGDGAQNNLDEDLDGYTSCGGDCDDLDPSVSPADLDGDGFSTCDGDCDDLRPAVNPAEAEICDGLDTDCDGVLPPDEVDADGDGYPFCDDCEDTDPTLEGADTDGDGYSTCTGDCNDINPAINPLATDMKGDFIDQNCDGVDGTDFDGDGYASLITGGDDCDDQLAILNLDDADGDGWTSCDGDCDDDDAALSPDDADGDGFAGCDDDCDDTDPAIHPHATEIPGDGVDDNCDGLDLCEDLNCDGWTDLVFTNNYDGVSYFQDSYIYWGSETGYSAANRSTFPTVGGAEVRVADLDGDGYLDLAVANQQESAFDWSLDSWIYWGGPTGYSASDRTALPAQGGTGVRATDLDGDGYLDLTFSNYWNTSTVLIDSYIYWGGPTGYSTADRTGIPTSGAWGHDVADVDGDGWPDILFANFRNQTSAAIDSWIYWGGPSGFSTGSRLGLPTVGPYGVKVADLDGDGFQDVYYSGFWDLTTFVNDSVIHWGSATGFNSTTSLPTQGATGLSHADLDGDGDLDLVFSNERTDGPIYSIPSYIYWNDGGFSAGNRQELETYGAVINLVEDLDGDGTLDIVFANWFDDTTYSRDSFIYWGTSGVYSDADRTGLPTIGAAGVIAAGPGIDVPRTTP